VPWSMGTTTVRCVSRLRMRSRRICLPIMGQVSSECPILADGPQSCKRAA
jgi:hypothetical protein